MSKGRSKSSGGSNEKSGLASIRSVSEQLAPAKNMAAEPAATEKNVDSTIAKLEAMLGGHSPRVLAVHAAVRAAMETYCLTHASKAGVGQLLTAYENAIVPLVHHALVESKVFTEELWSDQEHIHEEIFALSLAETLTSHYLYEIVRLREKSYLHSAPVRKVDKGEPRSVVEEPVLLPHRPRSTLELASDVLENPGQWLRTPNRQLGDRKPIDLIDTEEENRVYDLLNAVDQGLFS